MLHSSDGINDMTVSAISDPTKTLEKYDAIAAWACIFIFFLVLVAFSVFETYVHLYVCVCVSSCAYTGIITHFEFEKG